LESLFPSFPIPSFSQPKLPELQSEQEIEALADNIRQQWDLGLNPIPDLIDACENQGIKVFRFDEPYPKFDGLAAFINNNIPVIVISSQWPGDRQRFTLAHELGHLLLAGRLANHLDEEKCCNRFAGAFLLPKKSLLQILGNHRNYIEPRELSILKEEFGISMLSILHRIEDAGIISHKLYFQLRSEFNAHGWDKKEPGNPYPEEKTNTFEQMIFHALAEEFIGESKAAELMNIPIESLRTLRAMEFEVQ
jgi:Zn-dependent peptidase ImmA (M78 family)